MYALLSFSGHRLHGVEVAEDVASLQALVASREGEGVKWVQDGEALVASSPLTPLISYQIQPAAVR